MNTPTHTDDHAHNLRRDLAQQLLADGDLTDPRLRRAFEEVPRHKFVPRYFRRLADGRFEAAATTSDPEHDHLAEVYANRPLVTQLDGDDTAWQRAHDHGPITGTPTSSSSEPALMATMLEHLNLREDSTVLEIGTGTGYNAALLCELLDAEHVTTIDIDPELIQTASHTLHANGYTPTMAVADGEGGYPPRAPYDRIIATHAVAYIPPTWLAQTNPGGLILANLHTELDVGALALLTVTDSTAEGHFLPTYGSFMPPRSHTTPDAMALFTTATKATGTQHPTAVDAAAFDHDGFMFLTALLLDITSIGFQPDGDGPWQTWLLHHDGSWAYHNANPEQPLALQGGPQRLWDTVETAYHQWTEGGEPTRERFGLTVTPQIHTLWLDSPDSSHTWPLPPTPPRSCSV